MAIDKNPAPIDVASPEEASSFGGLADVVSNIKQGPWRFIQLRGSPVGVQDIDAGDVDFLGTRESVDSLLQAIYSWVHAGKCHIRVRARDRNKTALMLISLDGNHRILFDLWVELWQINNGQACLRYEDCMQLLPMSASSIQRLPVHVEACIYIHHLVAKKKDLNRQQVRERIAAYSIACRNSGEIELSDAFDRVLAWNQINIDVLDSVNKCLRNFNIPLDYNQHARVYKKLLIEVVAAWIDTPRKASIVALMGCDGSGKTTLARELAMHEEFITSTYTGKHLYRKSLLYKLATIFLRPLLLRPREVFDDVISPMIYLRACLSLQFKLWFGREGITLMDRSLMDFLMIDRKTDLPRFHKGYWLSRFFGRRIPTIHITVPYESLKERKMEMTPIGHAGYDKKMFNHYTGVAPTDYVFFYNGGNLESSRLALANLIRMMTRS